MRWPQPAAMIGLLRLHPSLDKRVQFPEMFKVEHLTMTYAV